MSPAKPYISYQDLYLRSPIMIEIKISQRLYSAAMKATDAVDSSDMTRRAIEYGINNQPLIADARAILTAVNAQSPRNERVQARTPRQMHGDLMFSPHFAGSYNDRAKICIGLVAGIDYE